MTSRERNIVSLTDVRLPALREEITELRERLQNVTEIFNENEQSFKIIAEIALALQGCETIENLDDAVGGVMIERSADHARFYVEQPDLEWPGSEHIRALGALDPTLCESLAGLTSTKCEACRSETYRDLLDVDVSDPASLAQIPVSHQSLKGVLVIGAENPDFFSNDVGTLYLDFLGATLACSTYRILAASSTTSQNQGILESKP
ncbi:MAG: DUF484 family protein [Gammaproteobacteria bacterium]|nr:DUF484 family protein [Gammaproteobacteria bacterium]